MNEKSCYASRFLRNCLLLLGATALCPSTVWANPDYSVGELIEVRIHLSWTRDTRLIETDETSRIVNDEYQIGYVDRIDEVKDGGATRVTRHFTRYRSRKSKDAEWLTHYVEGRQVTLYPPIGLRNPTWAAKHPVRHEFLDDINRSLLPESPSEWGGDMGSRKGVLKGVSEAKPEADRVDPSRWKGLPKGLPDALARTLYFRRTDAGKWNVTIEGDLLRKGRVNASIEAVFREDDEDDNATGEWTDRWQISMAIRPSSLSKLPPSRPPPPKGAELCDECNGTARTECSDCLDGTDLDGGQCSACSGSTMTSCETCEGSGVLPAK